MKDFKSEILKVQHAKNTCLSTNLYSCIQLYLVHVYLAVSRLADVTE